MKNKHNFRILLNQEQLKLTQEALFFYAKKLEAKCDSNNLDQLEETSKLCYNLKLLLQGEKQTGRRRRFQLWRDSL
jgi:hypothetical protein